MRIAVANKVEGSVSTTEGEGVIERVSAHGVTDR